MVKQCLLETKCKPIFGRTVTFALTRGMTDIVYVQNGGVTIDDGEILDNYQSNQVDFQWTEIIPVPTFWTDFMAEAKEKMFFSGCRHRIYRPKCYNQ